MWNIRSIKVVPVVVGILGSTSKKLKNCIKELRVVISTAFLQKTTLLVTARILKKVLDCGYVLWKCGWGSKKLGKGKGRGRFLKTEQVRKNVKI